MEKEEREMLQPLGFYSVLSQSGELAGSLAEYLLFPDINTEDQLPFNIILVLLSCDQLFAAPWIVAWLAPLSMEFSRQQYWSGLPFPSPGDLPARPPALAGGFFTTEPAGKRTLCPHRKKRYISLNHLRCKRWSRISPLEFPANLHQ